MTYHDFVPQNGDGQPLPPHLELSQEELEGLLRGLSTLTTEKGTQQAETGRDVYPIVGEEVPKYYILPLRADVVKDIFVKDEPALTVKDAELRYMSPHTVADEPWAARVENVLLRYKSEGFAPGIEAVTTIFLVDIGGQISGDSTTEYYQDGKRVSLSAPVPFDDNEFVDGYPVGEETVQKIQGVLAKLDLAQQVVSYDDAERLHQLIEKMS